MGSSRKFKRQKKRTTSNNSICLVKVEVNPEEWTTTIKTSELIKYARENGQDMFDVHMVLSQASDGLKSEAEKLKKELMREITKEELEMILTKNSERCEK
jgi:hypothetical protein